MSIEFTKKPYQTNVKKVVKARKWVESSLYRSDSVKESLEIIYNEKCAFCEQKPKGSTLQVEHFRPKDGIRNENHTGYYWLAFEWSNLLLACGNCNSRKGNHFPIINSQTRLNAPDVDEDGIITWLKGNHPSGLYKEKPVLINPEVDEPSKHIAFLPNGMAVHLSNRGEESIKRCNLNRNELVLLGRKEISDKIIKKLLKRLERYSNGQRTAQLVTEDLIDVIEEEVINPIADNESFSEFLKQLLLNSEDFIINRIENRADANILRLSFNQAIRNNI